MTYLNACLNAYMGLKSGSILGLCEMNTSPGSTLSFFYGTGSVSSELKRVQGLGILAKWPHLMRTPVSNSFVYGPHELEQIA